MKKITPRTKFILLALTAFASVILTQCRKTDMSPHSSDFSATKVISPIIERFFNTEGISEPVVARIVGNILLQEKRKPFVASFVRYAGYPVWSKAIVMNSRELYQNTFTQMGKEDYEQFVLIPLISAVDSSIQSVLQVRCAPEDTNFKMLYRWQYNQNGYGPDAITNNADKMALLFMEFERVVNGHDAFNILDSGLFRKEGRSPQKIKIGSAVNARAVNQKMLSIEVCYQTLVWVPDSHGQLVGCPPGEPCNTGHYEVLTEDCRSFSYWVNDWPGGGGVGSDVGESPGSGSGTGSTTWDEDPCSSGGSNGPMMRPMPPRGGCGDPPAWEPVEELIPITGLNLKELLNLSYTQTTWLNNNMEFKNVILAELEAADYSDESITTAKIIIDQGANNLLNTTWGDTFGNVAFNHLLSHYTACCPGLLNPGLLTPVNNIRWTSQTVADYAWNRKMHPEWSKVKCLWEATKESIHTVLDVAGMVPVVGEVFDLASGVLYTIEGDGLNATLSFSAMLPVGGTWVSISKLAKKAIVAIDGSRRTLKWVKLSNGIIDFGDRGLLRKVLVPDQ